MCIRDSVLRVPVRVDRPRDYVANKGDQYEKARSVMRPFCLSFLSFGSDAPTWGESKPSARTVDTRASVFSSCPRAWFALRRQPSHRGRDDSASQPLRPLPSPVDDVFDDKE